MDIHFISTLTPEDEDRFAPVVISAIKAILDVMPISYTLRLETANARVFQHTKADSNEPDLVHAQAPAYFARRATLS